MTQPLQSCRKIALCPGLNPSEAKARLTGRYFRRGSKPHPFKAAARTTFLQPLFLLQNLRPAEREHNRLRQAFHDCEIAIVKGKRLSGEHLD